MIMSVVKGLEYGGEGWYSNKFCRCVLPPGPKYEANKMTPFSRLDLKDDS